jgi:hypothetical protein
LGYTFAYFDGLNRFYVSDLHVELLGAFASPPNVFDDFTLSGTAQNHACVLLNEKVKRLEDDVHRLRGTLADSDEHLKIMRLEALQTERDLFEQLNLSQSENRKLADRVAKRERRIGEMHQIRVSEAKLARQIVAAAAQREELLALQLRRADAVTEKLQNDLASLLASWSWKITQPLRWLAIDSMAPGSMPLSLASPEKIGATVGSVSSANQVRLVDLLAKDGAAFVEAAYFAILRRKPDPQGAAVYQSILERGTAKIQILENLVTSPEGVHKNANLPGLAWQYRLYRLSRLPIIGTPIGFVFRSFAASRAQSIRSIDELLTLRGEAFVREAYRIVLNRAVDDEGLKNYMNALRTGKSKVQIISSLKKSAEGRKVSGRLRGLRRAQVYDKATRIPLVGRILLAWARSGDELVWCESKQRWRDKRHST